jgi:probable phosphoglycerate mutase
LAVIVCADGGSRGNPGVAGYGALVLDARDEQVLIERSEGIGRATNNVAEYRGLIAGLTAAQELAASRVEVRMDSKLVVEQMAGRWKVKHPDLQALHREASQIARGFESIRYTWVPRARNSAADRLANEAMDGASSGQRSPAQPAAGSRQADRAPDRRTPAESTPAATSSRAPEQVSLELDEDVRRPTTTYLMPADAPAPREWTFPRRVDFDASDAGLAAAAEVGRRLAPDGVIVVTSPLRHARQSAEAAGAIVVVDDGFTEADFGAWAGLTLTEVRSKWSELLDGWLTSSDVAPPGGESVAELTARVRAARDRVLARHGGKTVLVVSHLVPIKALIRLALDAGPSSLSRLHLDPGGLSCVRWSADGRSSVRLVNDTHHLTS